MDAVINNGKSLKYASEKLKSNFKIVVHAICNNYDAFKYASNYFKDHNGYNFRVMIESYKKLHDSKIIFLIGSRNWQFPHDIRKYIVDFIKIPYYKYILKAEIQLNHFFRIIV